MEDRLQHQPTAHEPQRAHTNRVRSTPQAGAKLEQTLLMNGDKLGSRSTGTTIVTFLMVFLIQNSQNRDGAALQVKLDELIRSSHAHNRFIGIEHLTDEEIE